MEARYATRYPKKRYLVFGSLGGAALMSAETSKCEKRTMRLEAFIAQERERERESKRESKRESELTE